MALRITQKKEGLSSKTNTSYVRIESMFHQQMKKEQAKECKETKSNGLTNPGLHEVKPAMTPTAYLKRNFEQAHSNPGLTYLEREIYPEQESNTDYSRKTELCAR